MSKQKTTADTGSVQAWLDSIDPPERRADAAALIALFSKVSAFPPVMWGSMVGFGAYHYRYESGTEGDAFPIGFAARASEFAIYLHGNSFDDTVAERDALLASLGKHRQGKGCLYVRRLSDIDEAVLKRLAKLAFARIDREYGVKASP